MNNDVIIIAKKELKRFFSNKISATVAILLPGVLIYAMWSFMGIVIGDSFSADDEGNVTVASINFPESMRIPAESAGIKIIEEEEIPDSERIRMSISESAYQVFAVFPYDFDAAVAVYDPQSGLRAPQVEIFFDSTDPNSTTAYNEFGNLLDAYESSLANRFDINAGETEYDVSDEKNRSAFFMASIVPMLLLILLFTGCMSIASEAIAGEKERGTMAALLATPIRRSSIALGKIAALSLIGLAIAASSAIGIFASLPSISQGLVSLEVYGPAEYALLALVIASMTLVIVMLISVISTLAKTTKEAQIYLTPLMVVVIAISFFGMMSDGAQSEIVFYLIPLYNSVQCMIGIFTFDFEATNVVVCVVANLMYTGLGVLVLQKMFNSERLMFAR